MRPDCGYGLLFLEGRFLVALGVVSRLEWLLRRLLSAAAEEDEPLLKLASFLTHVEKGRLRPVRS